MYAQVERTKENTASADRRKTRAIANSVAQKKSNAKQGFWFVDNRPESIAQRKMQSQISNSSSQTSRKKKNNLPLQNKSIATTNTIQRRWGPVANIALTGGGNYSVEASDNFDNFSAPVWGRNGVANAAPPVPLAPNTPAYVANVISTANGKDKNAQQVAAQYQAEAFTPLGGPDPLLNLKRRFALVYLANREELPYQAPAAQAAILSGLSDGQAGAIPNFPATAGYAFWTRRWRAVVAPQVAPGAPAQVGPPVAPAVAQTTAQVYAQFQNAANPAVAQAALTATMQEAGFPSPRVPAEARTLVKQAAGTSNYLNTLNGNGYTPFAHVGDADAVNLRVPPAAGVAPQELFNRFDAVIGANPNAEVITGGYRFEQRPAVGVAAPPHSAGATSPGTSLMAQTQQAVETSNLDQQVRGTMATVHPALPYFPEPNMLVGRDLYQIPGVDFLGRGPEWENMKNKIVRVKAQEWFDALGGFQEKNGGAGPWHTTFLTAALPGNPLPATIHTVPAAWATGPLPAPLPLPARVSTPHDSAWVMARLREAWLLQNGAGTFAFDSSAALVTDVGRFDRPYVESSGAGVIGVPGSGTNYLAGATDPLALFDNTRASQSHAKIQSIESRIRNFYNLTALEGAWLHTVAQALLPQHLWADLSDQNAAGTLNTRTAAAVARLGIIQPHLANFNAFADEVAHMIQIPAPLLARVEIEVNLRLGVAAGTPVLPVNITPADTRLAVNHILTNAPAGIAPGVLGVLGNNEKDLIYNAATAPNQPVANLVVIINLVRDIGKTIAALI